LQGEDPQYSLPIVTYWPSQARPT